ncbi:MAG: PAS domain S-box protein [Bacteroidales bacterium]|nr:PAS domain S-box protein [Bacteroidales bacterium]
MFSLIFCIIGILSFVIFRNYNNLKKIIFTDIELKKSEARFRGFIENTDNGLLIFENNIPVFSNNKFNEIFQVNQDSLPNFRLADYIPAWEQERVKLMMSKSFQEAKTRFTTWLSNEKFVNLNFINDTETAGYYQYLVVQDNTEQKQILTTIDILSENIAKSNDSVVITDLNGNIEYVNPGFENLTGYTFEEVKGKKPAILKSNKMEPVIYKDLWNTITAGDIWKGELLNRKKDGTLFWESTIIFPIKNSQNEIIKYSSVKTDITYKKRIEEELISARDKAEENNRLKTAFLNNISHEVRTPLNGIYGFVQVLQELDLSASARRSLHIIKQNCEVLLKLFDDIIDFSRIEARSVSLHKEGY